MRLQRVGELLAALGGLPYDRLQNRSEADLLLQPVVHDPAVRQFLLKNLQRCAEAALNGDSTWRFSDKPTPG
ncbi:MAG: hypothetical protein R2864_06830 [Syntrophotaleaceae bacterium]